MVEPLATIKGDFEFLSPIQNLEENILELNGYEEEVLSKMDDWSNGSTSTFPVTPRSRGSVDYPSTRRILVDVALPYATHENRAEFPLYGELYPNTTHVYNLSQYTQ